MSHILPIVFVICCSCSVSVSAQNLTWVWLHFPPAFIDEGPLKGQSITDRWLPQLQGEALGNMSHQFQSMTPARAWQTMKEGELLCHPAALYDEARAEYAAFSLPWSVIPDKAILMRKADAQRWFPGLRSIAVSELLERKDLRLGLLQDQHYYVRVAPWLNQSVAEKNAVFLSNKQPVTVLYRLLMTHRIDYMIEYPWVGGYLKRLLASEGKHQSVEIVSLALDELSQFASAYIACTNNQQGRKLIKMINQWLLEQRSRESFRQHVAVWLDENSRARFLDAYEVAVAPVTSE